MDLSSNCLNRLKASSAKTLKRFNGPRLACRQLKLGVL